MNTCSNGNLLLDHLSAGCALGLISDKEYVVFRGIQAMLQMVDNPATGAYTAAGDNDGRAFDIQQLLMVLVFLHGIKSFEIKVMVNIRLKIFRLFILFQQYALCLIGLSLPSRKGRGNFEPILSSSYSSSWVLPREKAGI